MRGYRLAVIFLLSFIAGVLLTSCATPTDDHTLRQATKALCEYEHDCLGMDRDYDQCETDALECGPDAVLACIGNDCNEVAQCLEDKCGRGVGLGVRP